MIKRAIFSVIHNKQKNIILFLVYFISALLLISSYCVRSSSLASIENMQKNMGTSVLVTKNDSDPLFNLDSILFPFDIGKEIAQLPQVKQEKYYSKASAKGINISGSISIGSNITYNLNSDIFLVEGMTDVKEYEPFKQGEIKLTKGRFLTAEDDGSSYAIINESIALNNKLDIGDKFSVQSYQNEEVTIDIEIVGFFTVENSTIMQANTYNYYFTFYTPVSIAAELNNERIMNAYFDLFEFNDAKAFIDEASKISDNYAAGLTFFEQTSDYLIASGPLNSLINLCNVILLSTILMAALILCLLVVYISLSRFHEIGIWLSMGESKFKIIIQITCEIIIPMLIAITFAIIVSISLILPYVEKRFQANLGINTSSLRDSILMMYFIGLILAVLSSLIPAINILRYNPKEILDRFD
ncbi:MAG: FtsX-like permease family protein [Oscillospiraceae bacterium]|nr:FtsX-like permease family protein [Oscillospiraceae bacterium]